MRAAVQQQQARPELSPTVLGLDVSNHQGDLADELRDYPTAEHVVVRIPLSVEPSTLFPIARQQAVAVQQAGRSLGWYVWAYRSVHPRLTVVEAVTFAQQSGPLPILWLDCEVYSPAGGVFDPGPDGAWLRAAFDECDRLGVRAGLYTAPWWIESYFPGGWRALAEFSARYVWAAEYNGIPTLEAVSGLWGQYGFVVAGHQYRGSPVDLNVFRRDVTR